MARGLTWRPRRPKDLRWLWVVGVVLVIVGAALNEGPSGDMQGLSTPPVSRDVVATQGSPAVAVDDPPGRECDVAGGASKRT